MSETRLNELGLIEAADDMTQAGWDFWNGGAQPPRFPNRPERLYDAMPGGTAIAVRKHIASTPLAHTSDLEWTAAEKLRCVMSVLAPGNGLEPVIVIQGYGFANAMTDSERLSLNEKLLQKIFAEGNCRGDTPVVILGDLNTERAYSAELTRQINSGNWVDAAAVRAAADGSVPADTFFGPRNASSRIDLCLMNGAAAELFADFEVWNHPECTIPQHRMQCLTLRTGGLKQRSLRTQRIAKLPESDGRQTLTQADQEELAHSVIAELTAELHDALEAKDVEAAWRAWCRMAERFLVERAALETGLHHTATQRNAFGRGEACKPMLREQAPVREYSSVGDLMDPLQALHLKLKRLIEAIVAKQALPVTAARDADLANLWRKACALRREAEWEELPGFWTGDMPAPAAELRNIAAWLQQTADQRGISLRRKRLRAQMRTLRAELRNNPARAFKLMKADAAPSLAVLKRPDGTFTGNIGEMDQLLRDAWGKVFCKHSADNPEPETDTFFATYRRFIRRCPCEMEALTVEDVLEVVGRLKATGAAGLDGWSPKDLKALPRAILEYLVLFYELVEATGEWPQALQCAAVTLIPKGEGAEPLDQRPLSVMPVVYRIWAAIYVRKLLPWQEKWIHRSQHGCRAKHSTSDAILRTALGLEQAMLDGEDLCGAALDFSKAFDNIPIAIALRLLRELGLPDEILGPLTAMYANLERRFKIRGSVGEAFRATNGIMQGCPLSVLLLNAIVSVLTRVLEAHVPDIAAASYVDDITLQVRAAEKLQVVFDVLGPFLELTAQVLNAKKTYLFGINGGRTVAIAHHGVALQHKAVIKVLGLEFHFADGKVTYGYSRAEIEDSLSTNHRIRCLPVPWWGRTMLCGSLVVGRLAYGCEVRTLQDSQERSVRTSTTATLWAKSGIHRNPGVIFTLLSKGHASDATQATLTARVLRWAKAMRNDPGLADTAWHMALQMPGFARNRASGPVNALLVALRRLGLQWCAPTVFRWGAEDFEVRGDGVMPAFAHAIRDAGRQMVWAQTRRDLARRHQHDSGEQVLGGIGAGGGVDRAQTLQLYNDPRTSEQHRGVLRQVLANGVYTTKLRAALPKSDAKQPWCTRCSLGARESLDHIWWSCPAWAHCRAKFFPGVADPRASLGVDSWPQCSVNCGVFNVGFDGPSRRIHQMYIDIFLERARLQAPSD